MDPVVTQKPRRVPILGPEPWVHLDGVEWCHWDWWFALVAATDFGSDLDSLERYLVDRLRSTLHSRRDLEAKLSHLADLRARLAPAGIDASTLASAAQPDKTTLAKARRKVLKQALEGRAMTAPMRDTPRVRLNRRARYDYWDTFPVNPDRWHAELTGRRPPQFVPKGRTFAITRQLRDRLARCDVPRRDGADRLALYRAFQTVGVELAERGDDSYGNIGELRLDAFRTYLTIDWAATGMQPEHRWQDLCELLVSEVCALTYQHETLPFRHVRPGEAEMVETILNGLCDEYRAAYQDYQADEALELIAWLHIAGHRYMRYLDAARRLGSDQWMPIVALAESALTANRHELAVEVFRAADQPGMHRDYLRDRCIKLTGVRLGAAASRLRIVEQGE